MLGADIMQTKEPDKTFQLLRDHIRAVRSTHDDLRDSAVHVIVERNLGFEAEHLYRECCNIPNCRFMCEPSNVTRIGVLTTQERKLGFVTYTNILLRENRMFAHDEMWVETEKNNSRQVLLDQLSFFGFTFMRPESGFQKEKFSISGKNAGGKDDICKCPLLIHARYTHALWITDSPAHFSRVFYAGMALLIGIYFAIDKRTILH